MDVGTLAGMERRKHGAITRVLRKLAKESDIPFNTLKLWYYDEKASRKKNELYGNPYKWFTTH